MNPVGRRARSVSEPVPPKISGGAAILDECEQLRQTRYPDGLPAGEAAVTTAGNLPAQYVIHTVGPIWRGGGSGEAQKLASCYRRSLEEAAKLAGFREPAASRTRAA